MAASASHSWMFLCVVVKHHHGVDEPRGPVQYRILSVTALRDFFFFTFILNTASNSCMLVQKGRIYVSTKEIPLCLQN